MTRHVPASNGSLCRAECESHFQVSTRQQALAPLSHSVITDRKAQRSVIILLSLFTLILFELLLFLPL